MFVHFDIYIYTYTPVYQYTNKYHCIVVDTVQVLMAPVLRWTLQRGGVASSVARRDQARRYGYNDGKDNGPVFKTPLG